PSPHFLPLFPYTTLFRSAFAIASFIDASTAPGVCSQSGIVRTAFALAAAARKSSTVLGSAPSRLEEVATMNNTQRRDDFMDGWDRSGHRFTQIFTVERRNFDECVFHLCSSVAGTCTSGKRA